MYTQIIRTNHLNRGKFYLYKNPKIHIFILENCRFFPLVQIPVLALFLKAIMSIQKKAINKKLINKVLTGVYDSLILPLVCTTIASPYYGQY